jgi:hypothetical protein
VKPVDFHPDAAEEAQQAAARYEGIRPGLGYEFRDELQSALASFRDNSLLYAAESGTIRIAPLHQFSYSLDKTCVGSCLALSLKGKKISDIILNGTKTQLPTHFLDSPLKFVGNQIRSLGKSLGL